MLDMINDFFQVGKNAFHVKCKKEMRSISVFYFTPLPGA